MKQRKRRKTLRKSVVYCGKQIWINRLQESKNDSNICIVISNGYTAQCIPVTGGYRVGRRDEPDISMFNENVEILACYYQPECDGLFEATDELEDFLECYAVLKDLWLIGHSKSAQAQIDIKYKMIPSYESINVITVSPTFGGTDLASENAFNNMPKRFSTLAKLFWKFGFKNIQVEKDVATNSDYIAMHENSQNLVTVNYVTKISSLRNVKNIEGLFNVLTNWILKYDKRQGGDGVVDVLSQTHGVEPSKNKFLDCPHCHGLSDACYDLVKVFSRLGKDKTKSAS